MRRKKKTFHCIYLITALNKYCSGTVIGRAEHLTSLNADVDSSLNLDAWPSCGGSKGDLALYLDGYMVRILDDKTVCKRYYIIIR